jgi:hypothetical protein
LAAGGAQELGGFDAAVDGVGADGALQLGQVVAGADPLELRLGAREAFADAEAAGFVVVAEVVDAAGGVPVPLARMRKEIS